MALDQANAAPHAAEFFRGCSEGRRYTLHEIIGKLSRHYSKCARYLRDRLRPPPPPDLKLGAYGVVCSATDKVTGEKVAIKKIQNVFDNVADATRILREITLLRLLQHADIVVMQHVLLPNDRRSYKDLFVVFELFESDLHTVIGVNDDLTEDHGKVFLYQLLRGINFVHQAGVLHRDLKPKNILANSNCKLKICDFGLARPQMDNQAGPVCWTDYIATRWYRSPELCGCFYGHYTQAVDIWSIACIFAEILLGRPLFPGQDAVAQLQLITDLTGKPSAETTDRISNRKARQFLHQMPPKSGVPFEEVFPGKDPAALDLLKSMLSFDPQDRPTAAEALKHPYFASLPDASVQAEPLPKHCFAFEHYRLTEHDVRELIYQEALLYHPHERAVQDNDYTGLHWQALAASLVDQFAGDSMPSTGYTAGSVSMPLDQLSSQQQQQPVVPGMGMHLPMDQASLEAYAAQALMPHMLPAVPVHPVNPYYHLPDPVQVMHELQQQQQAVLMSQYNRIAAVAQHLPLAVYSEEAAPVVYAPGMVAVGFVPGPAQSAAG